MASTQQDLIRFNKKLRKEGSCLLYGTAKSGSFWLSGKDYNPRTAAWLLLKGRAPKGKLTTTCDTRGCINIAHIVDTVSEAGKKNRNVHYKADRLPNKPLYVPLLVALAGDKEHPYRLPTLYSGTCKYCGAPLYFTYCITSFCRSIAPAESQVI